MFVAKFAVLASSLSASAALGVTPTVQFRIVERTGQTQVTTSDAILDLAVQAMVPSMCIGDFEMGVTIQGEPEANGTLSRALITNLDGTYTTAFSSNSQIGRGGVARQYSWLPSVQTFFNGQINSTGGSFTNGPDQEIGSIAGLAAGAGLLGTPGLDVDQDGNPDNWSGNGSGDVPADMTFVPVPSEMAATYFGSGQFVDIYRFRYVVRAFTPRSLHFIMPIHNAGVFDQFMYQGGLWGEQNTRFTDTPTTFTPLDISVVPSPAAFTLVGAAVAGALVRRRRLSA